MDSSKPNHYLLRVGDGTNFYNSKYPVWGIKRGKLGQLKTQALKINPGDILWFITNKKGGNCVIGMAEFVCLYDSQDEPFFPIHTFTNSDIGWVGGEPWEIQLNYKNLYLIPPHTIEHTVKGQSPLRPYMSCISSIKKDLLDEYTLYKKYATPIYSPYIQKLLREEENKLIQHAESRSI